MTGVTQQIKAELLLDFCYVSVFIKCCKNAVKPQPSHASQHFNSVSVAKLGHFVAVAPAIMTA